jgi:phosphoribosylformylglycinamidine synthase
MGNVGLPEITNVRIGKHVTLEVDAENETEANTKVDEACKKLLVNMTVESFEFSITKI